MGRWKKHKYLQKLAGQRGKKASETTDDWITDDNSSFDTGEDAKIKTPFVRPSWSWKQRCQVSAYLRTYKEGCECVYAGLEPPSDSQSSNVGIVIGQIQFPALTEQVFQQVSLALPKNLTKKHRKVIHECCVEQFLFHKTTGEGHSKTNPKTLWISPYADAFVEIHSSYYVAKNGLLATTTTTATNSPTNQGAKAYHPHIYQFRPWYCLKHRPWWIDAPKEEEEEEERNEDKTTFEGERCATPVVSNTAYASLLRNQNSHSFSSLDAQGISLVDALVDHPELCLREEIDVFDCKYWATKDLSDIEPPSATTGWILVDTPEKVKACSIALKDCRELGFDLEALNRSKYSQLTCLLQLTSNHGQDYVIDVLAPGVWDCVGPYLAPLFADPRIVKVGHSIGGLDVRSLHRDFGIFVINVFDTYEAAQVLGLESHGLASVCQYYKLRAADYYKDLKLRYQMTDWRVRPLTHEMLKYARYDVHYLLRLRWLMIRDLTQGEVYSRSHKERDEENHRVDATMAQALAQFREDEEDYDVLPNQDPVVVPMDGDDDVGGESILLPENTQVSPSLLRMQPKLMQVISRSQERCRDIWFGLTEPYLTHPMYMNILRQARHGNVKWTPSHYQLYEKLIEWRCVTARELEILPGFVAPLEFLIAVAFQRPVSLPALRRVSLRFPELLEDDESWRQNLLNVVQKSVAQGCNDTSDTETNEEYLLEYSGKPDPGTCEKIRAKCNRQLSLGNVPLVFNINMSTVAALALFTAVSASLLAWRRWRR